MILAIDPGTTQSGWCLYQGDKVLRSGVMENNALRTMLLENTEVSWTVAIEWIESFGMAVGKEVFITVRWIGRFMECTRNHGAVMLIPRKEVKMLLCGSMKAKDANIRQALLDRFPASGGGKTPQVGTKTAPGPLFGVSSHAWSALAVAVAAQERLHQAACSEVVQ